MDYKIKILPRAEIEITVAVAFYETRKRFLGKQFIESFNRIIDSIKETPELFSAKKSGFREVPLDNFPYLLIYKVSENEIIINSVFNTHQNPSKKP